MDIYTRGAVSCHRLCRYSDVVIVDFHNGCLLSAMWLMVVHEYKGLSFFQGSKLTHILPRFDFASTYNII